MKTFLVVFVAIILVMGSLEANAKRAFLHDRRLLLNDANPGQKVTTGANNKKSAQNGAAAADVQVNSKNVDDDSDSGTETHRYCPCETHECCHA
ncbi:hypothetical protein ACH5RR_033564 [Cinchona calisaya]|uniref:Uncharacterized protein n=1 Tax=Cinchona calisaya TaxID=153742 RepID=A0ABD2YLC0_9GENT